MRTHCVLRGAVICRLLPQLRQACLTTACRHLLLHNAPQLRRLELGGVRLAQFTPRLAQALSGLTHLATSGAPQAWVLLVGCVLGAEACGGVHTAGCCRVLCRRLTHALLPAPADLLAARPRRRAGITLWQGLRHLACLRELRIESQGGADLPACALACGGLTALSLVACSADDWPVAGLHRYGALRVVGMRWVVPQPAAGVPVPMPRQAPMHTCLL